MTGLTKYDEHDTNAEHKYLQYKMTVSYLRLRNNFLTGIANNSEKHLQILD